MTRLIAMIRKFFRPSPCDKDECGPLPLEGELAQAMQVNKSSVNHVDRTIRKDMETTKNTRDTIGNMLRAREVTQLAEDTLDIVSDRRRGQDRHAP